MRIGDCITSNYGHIGCATDVTADLQRTCSGHRRCVISVISLHDKRSCPKDFKSYLEVEFHCLTTDRATSNDSVAPAATGVISSRVWRDSISANNPDQPRLICVQPHQRINITLVDFSVDEPTASVAHMQLGRLLPSTGAADCSDPLVVISEGDDVVNGTVICGGQRRLSSVYLSISNCVHVLLNVTSTRTAEFLIYYQAFGCETPVAPPGVWLRLSHDLMSDDGEWSSLATMTAVFRCNDSEEAWHLLCRGTSWVGHVGNCSATSLSSFSWRLDDNWTFGGIFTDATDFPFGIILVLTLGVALGVAVGVLMLSIVVAYMRRHYRRKARRRLKTTISMSAADGDQDKKNSKLQTGTRRRSDSHLTVRSRSATMQTSRKRPVTDLSDPGTRRTSWQRVRPLPIPRLPLPLPPPLEDGPLAPVSPPDAEVPLLSPLSLGVSAPSSRGDLPTSRPVSHRRPPNSDRSADVGQHRLTTSGGSSPYYFKLDPALTKRQNNRHQRFYSQNPCFMCESEIR